MQSLCACCLTIEPKSSRSMLNYVDLLKKCFNMKIYFPEEASVVCEKCATLLYQLENFRRQLKCAQKYFKTLKIEKRTQFEYNNAGNQLSGTAVKPENVQFAEVEGTLEESSHKDTRTLSSEDGTNENAISVKVEKRDSESELALILQHCLLYEAVPRKNGEAPVAEEQCASGNLHEHSSTLSEHATSKYNFTIGHTTDLKRNNVKAGPPKSKRRVNRDRLPYTLDRNERTCPVCRKHFIFFKELSDHMHTHYPNHICDKCGKLCATKLSLQNHIRSHHPAKLECGHCGTMFKKTSTLKDHIKTAHKGEKKCYKCPQCSESFLTHHGLLFHKIQIHGYEEKRYKCSECDKRYNHGSHLRQHVRNEHRKEKNVQCELCHFAFFSKSALRKHMVSHTKEKKFKCGQCSKGYPRNSSLKQHLKIHANEKEFKCATCEKAFTQKVTLKKHMKTHKCDIAKEVKSLENINTISSMMQKL